MPAEVVATAASDGIAIRASCDNRVVSVYQLQTVTIELALEEDAHVYVDPVPDGYTALQIELTGPDELRARPPAYPAGEPFHVTGLPDKFSVVDGSVVLEGAFYVLVGRDTAGDAATEVTVDVGVRFQVCTADACYMPESITLPLTFELVANPTYETLDAASLRPLVMRRLDEQPRIFDDLFERVRTSVESHEVSEEAVQAMLDELVAEGFVGRDGDQWKSLSG
jgi:hypothetical protein